MLNPTDKPFERMIESKGRDCVTDRIVILKREFHVF